MPETTWVNEMKFVMNHAPTQDLSLYLLANSPARYQCATDASFIIIIIIIIVIT